jgi:hypothetical protein
MVDTTAYGDLYRRSAPEPRRDQATQITVYGYPVTLDKFPGKHGQWAYRVAAWMDERDVMRTKPLVEERFDEDTFYGTAYDCAKKADMNTMPRGAGITECFMVEWAMKNMRTIEDAAERRKGNPLSYTDLGGCDTTTNIPTRTFTGENGQTYQELDLRGEDTDPVLIEATKDRDRILAAALEAEKREKAEAERIRQEAAARRELEQAEFEAIPGFGSF